MPLLNNATTAQLTERINRLTAGSTPQWGRMTVNQMMAHCSTALKMAFGDVPAEIKFGRVTAAIARLLFIHLLPFPKGKTPTAPELDAEKKLIASDNFEAEKTTLLQQLARLNATPAHHNFALHPIFRKMNRKQWGKLVYKHVNHHLRQFGV